MVGKNYENQNSSLLINKAYNLYNMGRFEDAIKYCDEVIKTNPDDAAAWSIKGICLMFLRRYEEALSCCEKAISLNPEDASAWYNKASSEDALGKREEAIKSYNKFISLASEDCAMYVQYARWRIKVLSEGSNK